VVVVVVLVYMKVKKGIIVNMKMAIESMSMHREESIQQNMLLQKNHILGNHIDHHQLTVHEEEVIGVVAVEISVQDMKVMDILNQHIDQLEKKGVVDHLLQEGIMKFQKEENPHLEVVVGLAIVAHQEEKLIMKVLERKQPEDIQIIDHQAVLIDLHIEVEVVTEDELLPVDVSVHIKPKNVYVCRCIS